MLSLSALSINRRPAGPGTPAAVPGTIALAAFTRDRVIFDSGAAFGLAETIVPLSGSGTPAQIIQPAPSALTTGARPRRLGPMSRQATPTGSGAAG